MRGDIGFFHFVYVAVFTIAIVDEVGGEGVRFIVLLWVVSSIIVHNLAEENKKLKNVISE